MVTGSRKYGKWIAVFMACILIVLGLGAVACAQEEEPTIEEDYVVELNSVGDGHIEDTIKYSEEDFDVIKETSEENDGFLTRRYSGVDFTGEIVDFNTDFDDENESVVITYDMPGYAYNTAGAWMVYGFPEEPDKSDDRTYTITETSTINSEFTLFTDQVLETTTTIKLPEDARDVEYDSNEQALTYETVPADEMLGFWREHRTLLLIVFGVLFLLCLGLLVYFITRKSKVPSEALATPGIQTGPAPQPQVPAPTPVVQPPAPGETEPGKVPGATDFCPNCGSKIPEGKHFCTHCGKSLN